MAAPRVTLTFDNGPDREVTPRVLEILRRQRVTAHFYVLGKLLGEPWARALIARMREDGHFVGNHSFTHETPLGDDPGQDAVEREIAGTAALLDPLNPGPRAFRPFGGGGKLGPHLLSPLALEHLVAQRYSCVLWNSVPRDWVDEHGWPERAFADCAAGEHTVVVLHDLPHASVAHLEGFIERVRAHGMEIVADLPSSCVPIAAGEIVGDVRGIVRAV